MQAPNWTRYVLAAAAFWNIAWALGTVLWPTAMFDWAALPAPNYPGMVRGLGMMVGVFGVGYAFAATNPIQYWPIVFMGVLSKAMVAVGMTLGVAKGEMPGKMLWMVGINEVAWIALFGGVLYVAHDRLLNVRRTIAPEVVRMALRARTQHSVTIDELTKLSPVLLVFLRHAGCTFCREALDDLAKKRADIEKSGTRLVLVHMGTEAQSQRFFQRYGLGEVARVADPQRAIYRAFGLRRGALMDLFGPKVWWRGFQAGILGRHGVGALVGDGFQMPGVFLLYHGEILRSYVHQSAADRPDYLSIVSGREYAQPELSS